MCLACAALPNRSNADAAPFPTEVAPWPLDPTGASLRWTGVAGLRLDLDGVSIAFDPFVTRPGLFRTLFRKPRSDEAAVGARFRDLDAVFVGHTHFDHALDLGAVAAASPTSRLHGGPVTLELCRRLGLEAHRLVRTDDGSAHEVGPFRIETLRSDHGVVPVVRHVDRIEMPKRGLPATPFRYPRGEVFAWRLSWEGRVFHVQGSAGIDEAALERQGEADVLLVCLAARHGTPDYLKRLGDRLRPKVLVPIHHDDFFRPIDLPPRPVKTLDWPGFLRDAEAMEKAHGTRLHLLPFDREVAV